MSVISYSSLDGDQHVIYNRTLNESHLIDIRIEMYSKDEESLGELGQQWGVVAGQVDVDTTQAVMRQLSLSLFNPMANEDDVKGEGPFHPARFLEVHYRVLCPAINGGDDAWVDVPVFYGVPVSVEYDENTYVLNVTAQSKEMLLLAPNYAVPAHGDDEPLPGKTMRRLDQFIKQVAKRSGESRWNLAVAGKGEKVSIQQAKFQALIRENGVWPLLRKSAKGHAYNLFYSRDGKLTLKSMPGHHHTSATTAWHLSDETYTDKNGKEWHSNIVTLPTDVFDFTTFRNEVVVYSHYKKSSKTPTVWRSATIPGDRFGGQSDMARNDKLRSMKTVITSDKVLTRKKALRIAEATLKQMTLQSQEPELTALPIPHLDLYDVVSLHSSFNGTIQFIPTKWTLPLVAGGMSIGYNHRSRMVTTKRGIKTHHGRLPTPRKHHHG